MLETHNDYVRFHGDLLPFLTDSSLSSSLTAYQSALLMTPLLFVRISASLLGFPPWMRSFFTIAFALFAFFMA